ncbi:TIR domain-containing protein [Arcticibacterium luteifluviistationis]|uniref:CD-NTase-associated protein 12 n=1 Tax=Arcticibacterium luteifluviistationis TaxID=1784714 RepID=A0A2Z4G902_9BACT|nr:TIR domain-containing protein [Arcticibacterium luteifluviistationis]AWV97671.1 hypothetical protein DJ013_05630 [Arcticibacterium luteifluviistationis]
MQKNSRTLDKFHDGDTLNSPEGRLVKNLRAKKQKPSIFIGCSSEAHHIAREIQSFFNKSLFEVDTWKMSIFGGMHKDGTTLTISEHLKNFTDIYDFAIFLFVPDEEIQTKTRIIAGTQKVAESKGVKHNVIFEFGMFLGRLGAKRSIVLYHNGQEVRDFIELFFTDLKDDIGSPINDTKITNSFKLELYPFEGEYVDYINAEGTKEHSFNNDNLKKIVTDLQKKILKTQNEVDISFLPSTSLAFGYYNNFIKRLYEALKVLLKSNTDLKKLETDNRDISELILKKKEVIFYIIIPKKISEAKYNSIDKFKDKGFLVDKSLGVQKGRPVTIYVGKNGLSQTSEKLEIYDFPTTITSSIDAIKMVNKDKDIRELLAEKEKRNFIKVMESILAKNGTKIKNKNTIFRIEFIDLAKFKRQAEIWVTKQ